MFIITEGFLSEYSLSDFLNMVFSLIQHSSKLSREQNEANMQICGRFMDDRVFGIRIDTKDYLLPHLVVIQGNKVYII